MTGPRCSGFVALALILLPGVAGAEDPDEILGRLATTFVSPRIHGGAAELGVAGAVVTTGGTTVAFGLRGGRFLETRGLLFALEVDAGWTHVRDLDELDLLASAQWVPWPDARLLPFAGAIGGLRQEWVGSFRESRAPVGVLLGVRALAGYGAAFRTEYRYLLVTGDPTGNHGEHRVQFGVSLLLGNRPSDPIARR